MVTKSDDESDELKLGTNLSMILERSKEHTSSLTDISAVDLGNVFQKNYSIYKEIELQITSFV